jgi:hypothetical protein
VTCNHPKTPRRNIEKYTLVSFGLTASKRPAPAAYNAISVAC